jgi:hypothetical protein
VTQSHDGESHITLPGESAVAPPKLEDRDVAAHDVDGKLRSTYVDSYEVAITAHIGHSSAAQNLARSEDTPPSASALKPTEGLSLPPSGAWVYVVDRERHLSAIVAQLFVNAGVNVLTFGSVHAFLEYRRDDAAACLVVNLESLELERADFTGRRFDAGECPVVITQ